MAGVDGFLARVGLTRGGNALSAAAITALVLVGVGAGTALLVQLVLAQALGTAGFGTYQYVLGWLNVGIIVANFQFDVCATRYVAEYLSTGAKGLLRGFIATSRGVVARNAILLGAVAALGVQLFRHRLAPELANALLIACLLLPLNALLNLNVCSLQGFRRVTPAQLSAQVVRPVVLGLGVVALLLFAPTALSPESALTLNGAGILAGLAVSAVALQRDVRSLGVGPVEVRAADWWHTARGLMLVTVAQFVVSQQSDVLVAGTLLDKAAAGIYGAASTLASLIMLAVGAVSFIGAPAIATAHARGDRVELERVARHFSRLNLTFALPLAIVLVVAGERLLRLFGPDFVAGYWPLAMLVVVQLLSAGLGVQGGFLLTMTGRERMAGRIVAIGAVVNLLLTVVLTPTIGITGTALATLAATVLRIGWVVAAVRRELGVSLLR